MKQIKNIWFPDEDAHFEKYLDEEGNYQKNQFDYVVNLISPEDRALFIDIGAHVGLWSRMALKAGFKDVLAFEPNPKNFECLEKNIDSAYLCEFGLSDKDEKVNMIFDKIDNSGAIHFEKIEGEEGDVELYCFDNNFDPIKHHFDLTKKILVKIDVQGYEYKVVKGMTNFIKEYKPFIIVEQWTNGARDLKATGHLISIGMRVVGSVGKEVILGW